MPRRCCSRQQACMSGRQMCSLLSSSACCTVGHHSACTVVADASADARCGAQQASEQMEAMAEDKRTREQEVAQTSSVDTESPFN